MQAVARCRTCLGGGLHINEGQRLSRVWLKAHCHGPCSGRTSLLTSRNAWSRSAPIEGVTLTVACLRDLAAPPIFKPRCTPAAPSHSDGQLQQGQCTKDKVTPAEPRRKRWQTSGPGAESTPPLRLPNLMWSKRSCTSRELAKRAVMLMRGSSTGLQAQQGFSHNPGLSRGRVLQCMP